MNKKPIIFIGIFLIFILAIASVINETYIKEYRQGILVYDKPVNNY